MYEVLKVQTLIILDSSMVEHSAVNRVVVGSSPTRGVFFFLGSMVKRLRHRPFTAVTRVRFPSESFNADVAQLAEQLICNQQVIGSSPIIGFIQFNIELYYGQIPEWPKGTDCKSAATCFDGSNPSLPITLYRVTKYYRGMEQSGSSPGS